ncbi:hypothetical protein [Frankia sp. CeD]|uniref:hypothetical protein n=1 Tax=Frankia sp. CeD TaxID=258230 RepID=UPI0004DD61FF|nr:hypothetical protein [Frankia sp. CeD]KEZ37067.1 hypothetical protein CEDDRAFT_01594 [Frankia sp. CeD]
MSDNFVPAQSGWTAEIQHEDWSGEKVRRYSDYYPVVAWAPESKGLWYVHHSDGLCLAEAKDINFIQDPKDATRDEPAEPGWWAMVSDDGDDWRIEQVVGWRTSFGDETYRLRSPLILGGIEVKDGNDFVVYNPSRVASVWYGNPTPPSPKKQKYRRTVDGRFEFAVPPPRKAEPKVLDFSRA